MSREREITAEVRALETLGLEALRAEWRRIIGPPPKARSPDLLRLILAWRIQSQALGGFTAETRAALRSKALGSPRHRLAAGTRITREWQGKAQQVVVLADGAFEHEGRCYRSLSAIARKITGVRWNGPRFFGLRDESAA